MVAAKNCNKVFENRALEHAHLAERDCGKKKSDIGISDASKKWIDGFCECYRTYKIPQNRGFSLKLITYLYYRKCKHFMFSILNSRTDAVRMENPYLSFFNPDLGEDEILILPCTTRKNELYLHYRLNTTSLVWHIRINNQYEACLIATRGAFLSTIRQSVYWQLDRAM